MSKNPTDEFLDSLHRVVDAVSELMPVVDAGRPAQKLAEVRDQLEAAIVSIREWLADAPEFDVINHQVGNLLAGPFGRCALFARKSPAAAVVSLMTQIDKSRACLRSLTVRAEPMVASSALQKSPPAHLLLADDDEASVESLRTYLKDAGHTVTYTRDGQQAIAVLKTRTDIDLVLLDVQMPVIDGPSVLHWIKNNEQKSHIPVIMMSGSQTQQVVDCIANGAEDFLEKPIDFTLLDARVNSCLRRRQAEKNRLLQYFSSNVAKELQCNGELLATRDAMVTILFCDIRRFSTISERIGSSSTIEWIGETMERLATVVFEHDGSLVDYTGDGLMAMWGAPREISDHADKAIEAGLEMLRALNGLNHKWQERLGESVKIGVGINSGIAAVGVIGREPKFKYGPLGPTVNLASRVEGVTKQLGCDIILTQSSVDAVVNNTKFNFRRLCRARVTNVVEPADLFQVCTSKALNHRRLRQYEESLGLFENRHLAEAAAELADVFATGSTDVPEQLLMARILSAMADEATYDPLWTFSK